MEKAVCILHIREDGKVLAVARRHTETEWGLPGGKVDPGEDPKDAASRELKEETHTTPLDLREIYSGSGTYENYHVITYIADNIQGSPRQGDAGPVAYVTWEELIAGPFGDYNYQVWKLLQ